ncbi:MAG: hypothetical protein AB1448_11270 [Pseudomonadota bacterium]
MPQQSGPFAAGSIDRPASRRGEVVQPITAPRPLVDRILNRETEAPREREAMRVEALEQSARWERHRAAERALGRPIPVSMSLTGQRDGDGKGALTDAQYEARLDELRREFPDAMRNVETRQQMLARVARQAEESSPLDRSIWQRLRENVSDAYANSMAGMMERDSDPELDGFHLSDLLRTPAIIEGKPADRLLDALFGDDRSYWRTSDPGAAPAARRERARQETYDARALLDPIKNPGDAIAFFAGQAGGSIVSPENLISPGRTILARAATGAAVAAGADVVLQQDRVQDDIQDAYRPEQTLLAGGLAGAFSLGGDAIGAGVRRAQGNPSPAVRALASEIDAGSRALAASPAPSTPPAVRAAVSRIERDAIDRRAIGPAGGAEFEAVRDALEDFTPAPQPAVERDIDALIGDSMTARETAPAGSSIDYQGRPITEGSFDPMRVEAAPATFQYKASGEDGLTDRLAGVTAWDRTAAGRSILFEDDAGRVVVADGHQRRGLARRLIESGQDTTATLDGFLFRQADGWEPSDVRVVAAMKNIREGSGSILDAAKVFREAPDLINDRSLPITGDFIASARGLARLSDDAFGEVATGVIPDRYGSVIGELAADVPELHTSLVDLMRQGQPRSLDEARAYVQEARLADFVERQGAQDDLFGGLPRESTLIARARLRAAVLKQLRGDARLFGALVRNADAIEAGGNALARSDNEMRVARDLAASSAIDKLALRAGTIGDTFGEAAAAVARGDLSVPQASRSIVDELRTAQSAVDAVNEDRRALLNPDRPSDDTRAALSDFSEPGGRGQAAQAEPKPEDAAREQTALWDDLPEIGDEDRALSVLSVCAPGGR